MKTNVLSLKSLIEIGGEQAAHELISIFSCNKDPDIEEFLKNPKRAIEFEKLGKSRTFLIYNDEVEHLEIVGYYSLALQVFKVPTTFSGNQIKKFDGLSAKKGGQRITEFPALLIGQLAKSDIHSSLISGDN